MSVTNIFVGIARKKIMLDRLGSVTLFVFFLAAIFAGLACRSDVRLVIAGEDPVISLEVNNLPAMQPGEGHYEAWISFASSGLSKASATQHEDSSFVSIGKFAIDSNGQAIDLSGKPFVPHLVKSRNLQYMVDAIITVELEGDSDDTPGSAIIGGEVRGDIRVATIDLTPGYQDAIGADFGMVEGYFLIDTPTSTDSADSASGIWFMQSLSPQSAGLLNLPVLAEGWKYEGWVRTCCIGPPNDRGFVNYTTGTFTESSGFDSDSAGYSKGPVGNGYPYPGEDFAGVKRHILNNDTFDAFVTIEPDPDNSPAPFRALTLLAPTMISSSLPLGQPRQIPNNAGSFPSARITVIR